MRGRPQANEQDAHGAVGPIRHVDTSAILPDSHRPSPLSGERKSHCVDPTRALLQPNKQGWFANRPPLVPWAPNAVGHAKPRVPRPPLGRGPEGAWPQFRGLLGRGRAVRYLPNRRRHRRPLEAPVLPKLGAGRQAMLQVDWVTTFLERFRVQFGQNGQQR